MRIIHTLLSDAQIDYIDSLINEDDIMNRTEAVRKIIREHIEAHK